VVAAANNMSFVRDAFADTGEPINVFLLLFYFWVSVQVMKKKLYKTTPKLLQPKIT